MERKVDVAIIGAGTSGLTALGKVRHKTSNFVLIDGGELGTTCARVGCMPSKVAIQVAEDFHRRQAFQRLGIRGQGDLSIDVADAMEHIRDLRDIFVDQVLSSSTDEMGDEFIQGYARFVEPNLLDVDGQLIRAKSVVIATGSRPIIPTQWAEFGDRVLTTDELFEQEELPPSMAVIGLGVIGLELGQALHRLGLQVTGVDVAESVGGLSDPVVAKVATELMAAELPLWLGAPALIEAQADGRLRVSSGERSVVVDKILASVGRTPNLDRLGLAELGVEIDAHGVPLHSRNSMQIGDLPIFIAGDVNVDRPILHEASDEGRIAGYNAVAETPASFRRRTPLAITFCDPNIAAVGASWDTLDRDRVAVGEIRFGPVGRALILGKNKGVLRVYADKASGRLLGGAMVAPRGEHLAHLLAWAVQQQLSVSDLLKMPFYHPTLEEALQVALYHARDQLDGRREEMVELHQL